MAKICIIGGHGKIARLLEPLLVQADHEVVAWIRSQQQADDIAATGATPVILDVEVADVQVMATALDGMDVVVWSAGAGGGDPARTYAVDRDAAMRSVQAAVKAGVSRYLMVSYFGASPDHGVPEGDSFYPYAQSKATADAHLIGSGQAYTILAPSRLTDEPGTGMIEIPGPGGAGSQVTRADVAATVASCIELIDADPQALRDITIAFNNGDTPIVDALRSLPGGGE